MHIWLPHWSCMQANWFVTPNEGCQNNRVRALGSVNTPKLETECSMRGRKELSSGRKEIKSRSLWPVRRHVPLNKGNLFLIVKRVISFFLCIGTYRPESNGVKHYEIWWGKPINEGENGQPFFWCVDTAWSKVTSAKAKTPSFVGNSSRCVHWAHENWATSHAESFM